MRFQDRIAITVTDHVADVRLDRADKMNALDPAMFAAIPEATAWISAQADIRAVVLSGEGKAFCAGLDMMSMAGMAGNRGEGDAWIMKRTHGISNIWQYAAIAWSELDVPVIAALHGVAFGGGFQLALGADIRVAHPETRFSVMEMKWGIIPDMGGTELMRRVARDDVIRELTYTAREFACVEAEDFGFVTHIADDPLAVAMDLARAIAGRNPDAVRAAKRMFNASAGSTPAARLLLESKEQGRLIGSPNQMEAVAANFQKRAPIFK